MCKEPGCGRCFSVHSNLRRHQKAHHASSEQSDDAQAGSAMGPPPTSMHAPPYAVQQQSMFLSRPESSHRPHAPAEHASLAPATHRPHPPLSRSAYELGARASLAAQHWPGAGSYGQQLSRRERNLSASSGEGDEDAGLRGPRSHPRVSDKAVISYPTPQNPGQLARHNTARSAGPAFFPARVSSRPHVAHAQHTPMQALSPDAVSVSDGETESAPSPAPSDRTLTSRRDSSTGAMRHSFATLLNDPGR